MYIGSIASNLKNLEKWVAGSILDLDQDINTRAPVRS